MNSLAGAAEPEESGRGQSAELRSLVALLQSEGASKVARQDAFVRLVEWFQDGAFGYAYGVLGDPHLAQDATQEAFAAAFRQIGALRSPDAFPAWLRRIVRTHCLRLRRGETPQALSLDALRAGCAAGAGGSGNPSEAAEARELRDAVAAAVGELPRHERVVVVLCYAGDWPQEEIAQFLGVPLTAVKKRLQSARRRLEKRMLAMIDDALTDHMSRYLPSRDERLIESLRFLTAFGAASSEGELPLVEQLLVDGLHVDTADASGRTLISLAAQRGNVDAVELLLRHGADVNARDAEGVTPRGWAERAGQRAVVALLRRRGALP